MPKFLITGVAGFIGYHVAEYLLARGDAVVGIDSLNDYYDPRLKHARLRRLQPSTSFTFLHGNIAERRTIDVLVASAKPDVVINLAAQAGVRYSLTHPHAYLEANIVGFLNVLEACRHNNVRHLVYASSSSVYGANTKLPFSVADAVDHPVSLYAATKKANELMAHTYSHLYALPTTGLRFFTVYGPWGRPDMALFLFTRAILAGEPIDVFNHGEMKRDFTYIDDIVEGVVRVADRPPTSPDPLAAGTLSRAPYRIYNIGNNDPVGLLDMIRILEECLGREAVKRYLPLQPGDVPSTYADVSGLEAAVGFRPSTSLEVGIRKFVDWYTSYAAQQENHGLATAHLP
ncbi:MAG: NAD-dependent epimerase [Gemmatimonadaceae bacterium]